MADELFSIVFSKDDVVALAEEAGVPVDLALPAARERRRPRHTGRITLHCEAADAVRAVLHAKADAGPAVHAVLVNSGLHDPTDPDEAACLERDVEAVVSTVERVVRHDGGSSCP